MAIEATVDVREHQTWPQGDIRDPLGIWGFRHIVTGDASGGGIKLTAQVPAARRAAFVYTCYALTYGQLTGALSNVEVKARLLTNWPDMDDDVGVQGFSTARVALTESDPEFTAPLVIQLANQQLVQPNDRFVLLFDPRPNFTSAMDIVEMENGLNVDTLLYAFEGYGYYWDRSVLDAPGGPRHPGS